MTDNSCRTTCNIATKACFALLATLFAAIAFSGCSTFKSTQDGLSKLIAPKKNNPNSRNGSGSRDDFDFGQTNPNRLVLSDLSPSEITTTVRAKLSGENKTSAERKFRGAQATYDQAIELWEQDQASAEAKKLFLKSAREFKIAGASWRDSALEQDSLFMIGEAQFFAHQYVLANRAYEQLVSKYQGTQHMDLVQSRRYTIAVYWLELARDESTWSVGLNFTDDKKPLNDWAGHARRILHSMRLDDPTGKIADDATFALGNAYYEAGKFEDAADAYEDLRRTYPGSKHQFKSHLFELKCRMSCYRGADYDGTQLIKAEKIMQALVTQFPDKINEHQDYVDQEAGKIRNMLADRDYTMGQYFEGRGENRAANVYYDSVAQNYADTDLAKTALERTSEISDSPAVPPTRAAWLVNLFPQPRATKPLISTGNGPNVLR